ncbi:PQQ-binding-like beta-propeller repeat protein [Woodsholea maritima]|uniref:PQQ-binding-like beta-propeller repeat protein n=1 Tax=Woodsholea maritima TaxID=240237 RepID=UPI00035E5CC7|nr:PQQ-binding-like beta-propeller repeat protein [Woodsholea maritima]
MSFLGGTAGISDLVLSSWYQSKNAVRLASQTPSASSTQSGETSSSKSTSKKDLPPWDPRGEIADLESVQRKVLSGGAFFDDKLKDFSNVKASKDEKTLYAMYQGVRRLQSLAAASMEKGATDFERRFWNNRFQEGLEEMTKFFDKMELEGVSVLKGEELTKAESDLRIKRGESVYTTGIVHTGAYDAEVANFQGDVKFDITVRKSGADQTINIDLADMGATPRNLDNVADFINSKLDAAGVKTRFERVKIGEKNEDGIIEGNNFGFKIEGIITERVTFSAVAGEEKPAIYVAGISGDRETAAGQLTRIVDVANGGVIDYSRRIEAAPTVTEVAPEVKEGETPDPEAKTKTKTTSNPTRILDTATGPDGALYTVGETTSTIDGVDIKGDKDLVLSRYDATGKLVWSRVLGASDEASGASLAVDDSGNIVVAGSVKGVLGDTNAVGGSDSLVVKYNSAGVEQWTKRFGALKDDQANDVTIADDGTIFVAGQTKSNLGGAGFSGEQDGYVRAFDGNGATLYTRATGATSGVDAARAVAVAQDGGLLVATEENGQAVLRKYGAGDDGTGAPVWETNLGNLSDGRIGGLAVDESGAIYLAGSAGADFAPGAVVQANAGARDAFVTKITDGASPSVDYVTFLGSGGDDGAAGVAVANGKVYVTGKTAEGVGGAIQNGDRNMFVASVDGATGVPEWAQQVSGRGGLSQGFGIAVDTAGDTTLAKFGLPSGALTYSDSRVVTDRSAVRAGDHFYVSVDGGRKKKITLDDDDTMRALTFKINSALVLSGDATLRRSTKDGDQLIITPKKGVKIEFIAGKEGQDALKGLGLPEGVVTGKGSFLDRKNEDETADAPEVFALGLGGSFDISDKDLAAKASEALTSAMSKIQRAYRELTADPALKDFLTGQKKGKSGGPVPAYLTSQINNYQAGLNRLLGGGGGNTSLFL